jgi:hypothetical protein
MSFQNLIHLPLVNMREFPSQESKICSQALFGEEIKIYENIGDWVRMSTPDGYSGWIQNQDFLTLNQSYRSDIEVSRLCAHLYREADTEYGPLVSLCFGSKLQLIDASDLRWLKVRLPDERIAYIQRGDVEPDEFELVSFAKKFIGIPYTWGGRSSFGYDCSGYVQMLYSRMGFLLPRDARQQICDPRGRTIPKDEWRAGDLIFWGKSEDQIRHVGMLISGSEFIHTSSRENMPYLRISKLTDKEWSSGAGVFYPFRSVRRFLA